MGRKPATVSLRVQTAVAGQPLSIEISSHCYQAREWTVRRRRDADGPAERVQLRWKEPITGFVLWGFLAHRAAGDPDWQAFRFLEASPTDEGGPA